mmetsp:Transcript_122596/g.308202  ORF Transcript_122596/g.308202 Transcript_122596/m.308202 type:complete len:379 (+) Transcript_122596:25-1161(+)
MPRLAIKCRSRSTRCRDVPRGSRGRLCWQLNRRVTADDVVPLQLRRELEERAAELLVLRPLLFDVARRNAGALLRGSGCRRQRWHLLQHRQHVPGALLRSNGGGNTRLHDSGRRGCRLVDRRILARQQRPLHLGGEGRALQGARREAEEAVAGAARPSQRHDGGAPLVGYLRLLRQRGPTLDREVDVAQEAEDGLPFVQAPAGVDVRAPTEAAAVTHRQEIPHAGAVTARLGEGLVHPGHASGHESDLGARNGVEFGREGLDQRPRLSGAEVRAAEHADDDARRRAAAPERGAHAGRGLGGGLLALFSRCRHCRRRARRRRGYRRRRCPGRSRSRSRRGAACGRGLRASLLEDVGAHPHDAPHVASATTQGLAGGLPL